MDASDRELLRLVSEGRTLAQIAAHLQIGEGTVKRRLRRLRHELDAPTNISAVVTAIKRGEI